MGALAERAGLHRTYIGLLERGERQPTVVAASSIAEALGLDLSKLLQEAELSADSKVSGKGRNVNGFARLLVRRANRGALGSDTELRRLTGLTGETIALAIDDTYRTLDLLDHQLLSNGVLPFSELVELANLSSMLGNIVGGAIVNHSNGLYERSGPHKYQDLRSLSGSGHVEIKTALESNKPKGHLSKAGIYLTIRYVLADRDAGYMRGARGDVCAIWEVRVGHLTEDDFSESNTPGDSGKTAVVKTEILRSMERVYFDPLFFPYARLDGPWGLT